MYSEEEGIIEVRGILNRYGATQHLDDYIIPVVEERLRSLPGGEQWQEQMQDMRRLATIHMKHLRREELSRDDLRFLYEIDREIQGTGYGRDPRIEEIISGRDVKDDLSLVFGVPREQISTTEKEAFSGRDIKCHYGDLIINLLDPNDPKFSKFPEIVIGNLIIVSLGLVKESFKLRLPRLVKKNFAILKGPVFSAERIEFPEVVGKDLNLNALTSAKWVKLPEKVGRDVFLNGLVSPEGLKLPKVGRHIYLNGLRSARGLELPESVEGDLFLNRLVWPNDLRLPESIKGNLGLHNLASVDGLEFPESVGELLI